MEHAIEINNLRKSFGKLEILKGVDLKAEKGSILALLGPNGAGKTTTIRILSTLLPGYSGSAKVNGYEVSKNPSRVRESIGLTGQYAAVDEYLTGRENLEMIGRLYRLSAGDSEKRAFELLEQFGLMEAKDRPVKTYSGGMRRRLDLALSLMSTPPVIFLDEPTTGLDPASRLMLWDIIRMLVDAEVTILLTTQYLEEADLLADKIAVLHDGRIIAEGTAEELKKIAGKERLNLVIGEKSDFAKISSGLSGEDVLTDREERKISLATGGNAAEIKRVLDYMSANGAAIESLTLEKPTLDDVFLHLTGHAAVEDRISPTNDNPAS